MLKKSFPVLWLLIFSSFITSLFAPLFTVQKFFVFENTLSIANGLITLAKEQEWFLAVILLICCVLLPLYKNLLMLQFYLSQPLPTHQRLQQRLALISKWAMLDVFVVALLVVMIKFKGIASVQIEWGFYLFALSVLASHGISSGLHYFNLYRAQGQSHV